MQVKTIQGATVQISASQCQRVHKITAAKAGAASGASADQLQFSPHAAYNAAQQYKDKASHNIKRIGQLDNCPTTQDDVKHALIQILIHGTHWQFVDALAQMAEFQAARVVQHSLKHSIPHE